MKVAVIKPRLCVGGCLYLSMYVRTLLPACRGVWSKSSLCWIPPRWVFTSWLLWSTVAAYTWWVTRALCKRRKVFKSRTHLTSGELCVSLSQDYVQALTGLCYDGVEGLIYLVLFSFVTALMFSSIVCSVPHTWPGKRWHTQTHTCAHRQTNTCQGTFTNTDKTQLSLYIPKSLSFINQCTNK